MGVESINLARTLGECVKVCNYCLNACLKEDDVKMMADCIRLDKQCAEICSLTLNSLNKDGKFMEDILILCKNACQACADECGRHPYDHCKKCAEVCTSCVQACSQYLNDNVSNGMC